jgi:hypothetical protein
MFACLLGPLCVLKNVAGFTFSAFISGATAWISASGDWAWHTLGTFLAATSDPTVVIKAATPEYLSMLAMAPLVALIALVANVLSSLRRIDPGALVRDTLMVAPLIILGVLGARPLAQLVLNTVDALSSGASAHASSALATLTSDATFFPSTMPAFAVFALALLEVVGAMLLWFELVVRNAVLALLLAFAPIVFASALWSPLRKLSIRLVETFVAIALSKFVIVVALSLGVQAVQSDSLIVIITGIAVCLLAVVAPFTLLRIVPLVELSALHALDGLRQRATSGAKRAASMAGEGVARMQGMPDMGPAPIAEDWGIPMWEGEGELEFPPRGGPTPVAPIGEPLLRGGQPAFYEDDLGPVMGWHFDE